LEETKHQVKGIETPKRDSIIHFFLNWTSYLELESSLELLTIKENAIKKAYDEKVESVTEYKGELAQYNIEIEQDENKCKELEKEIENIEKQMEQLLQPEGPLPSVDEGLYVVFFFFCKYLCMN
jgi:septal ring factor EnvC (AmiA/AmiB activator)